jgi:hypothetical protein
LAAKLIYNDNYVARINNKTTTIYKIHDNHQQTEHTHTLSLSLSLFLSDSVELSSNVNIKENANLMKRKVAHRFLVVGNFKTK